MSIRVTLSKEDFIRLFQEAIGKVIFPSLQITISDIETSYAQGVELTFQIDQPITLHRPSDEYSPLFGEVVTSNQSGTNNENSLGPL